MNNPTFSRDKAEALARSRGCTDQVMLIGFRSATSKYGEYDDTLALLTPEIYTEWKGNTLPSEWIPGIAKLMPGDYDYTIGLHGVNHFSQLSQAQRENVGTWLQTHIGQDYPPIPDRILPYWAFRQAAPVTLIRDGDPQTETEMDPDKFPFIDLHRGGWNGTSSAGCQTWYPDHWLIARASGYAAMAKYGQKKITYALHQL